MVVDVVGKMIREEGVDKSGIETTDGGHVHKGLRKR